MTFYWPRLIVPQWLHKLVPRLHLKTPKHYAFSFSGIRVTFQYFFLLPLCSITLFQRVLINFTPFLISFNLYLLKKNQKLLILHPGHPSLCTLLISKILHHLANKGSYEICSLIYFFQKKKKKHFFLITLYVHSMRRISPYKHFWKAPQTENPTNPRPHA